MPALRASWLRAYGGLTQLTARLLDLIFPPRCVGCRRPGTILCAGCRSQVQWHAQSGPLCRRCGRTLGAARDGAEPAADVCAICRRDPLPLDGVRSAVTFAGPVRNAVHQFKYRGRRSLAPLLAEFMLTAWQAAPAPADLVAPVPLHAERLAARGYNQAAMLARAFAGAAGLDCAEDALERTRATAPQVELDARHRRGNVQAAFRARPERVAGRQLLLVDDVCTTGATLGACAEAARAAGAKSVWAFTLARARWDPEQGTTDDN